MSFHAMTKEEVAAWLQFIHAKNIKSEAKRSLLAACGLPYQILQQSRSTLMQFVPAKQADALLDSDPEAQELIETTWQWLQSSSQEMPKSIITLGSPHYPEALLQIADPPLLLYALGQAERLQSRQPRIAMVGSRNPTPQGASNARAFAAAFAEMGWTVVSGLALGIDGEAHIGALQKAPASHVLPTIAVVGTGLDRVYPRQHHELAHRIARQGLIVSESPLGTPPLAHLFPRRNRIISGLSHGVLVVEAALQSGSLITARLAAEQGKEVFAIPGSIHAPQARGCHALIKQGAKLVECTADVIDELGASLSVLEQSSAASQAEQKNAEAVHTADLTGKDKEVNGVEDTAKDKVEKAAKKDAQEYAQSSENALNTVEDVVLQALGYDPVGLDALLARTGMGAAVLQVKLLELELSGDVGRLAGGLYQRVGRV